MQVLHEKQSFTALALLLVLWVVLIAMVNPVGDFMVNDDWSFTRALETLMAEGRVISTGWGPSYAPGGPALVAQLFWAYPFAWVAGPSPTVLRISVLVLAVLGSLGLFCMLRKLNASPMLSLFGTLVLILNPLFLSQAFSFMTDVPFTAFMIFSLLSILWGLREGRFGLLLIGLLFGLAATLTRQIGIVITIALVVAVFAHPAGRRVGRARTCAAAIAVGLLPWLAFEAYLMWSGGTSLADHQVIHKIFRDPMSRSFLAYVELLGTRLGVASLYCCFLVAPISLAFSATRKKSWAWLSLLLILSLPLFALLEVDLLAGYIDLPRRFYQNVIFNFGIGPALLKDTYILGVSRTWSLPTPWFYLLFYVALVATAVTLRAIVAQLVVIYRERRDGDEPSVSLFSLFILTAAAGYLAAILLTGFHDRYLVPICLALIVWFYSDLETRREAAIHRGGMAFAACLLAAIGLFSLMGTHDFMAMKRAQSRAYRYAVKVLGSNPCHMDAGFEFNGYNCYDRSFKPKPGLSWWWVEREDNLLTLGPLPGYTVMKKFPFSRWMGPDGAIHLLQPAAHADDRSVK